MVATARGARLHPAWVAAGVAFVVPCARPASGPRSGCSWCP